MPQHIINLPGTSKVPQTRPRVAVIGTGIAGLSAAWALQESCDLTLFEKNAHVGGHTNTVVVDAPEGPVPVDTGFIVFNEKNYPNLTALFAHLGVVTNPTQMHFSVSARDRDMEYASSGVGGLFADLRNLVRPRFFSMVADILRFYAAAPGLAAGAEDMSIGEFLIRHRYSSAFMQDHLLPMAAAIWSCPARTILEFPAKSLARFFVNHGLAELGRVIEWRTVDGGSRSYVAPMTKHFADRIHLQTEVAGVRREAGGVAVRLASGEVQHFDEVVFACHAPEAFALLEDADADERRILSAFRTQANRAVLHTDASLMPRRRRAWASWNYLSHKGGEHDLSVTYWMNALQRLGTATDYFVTLNPAIAPRPETVVAAFDYQHPVFDAHALSAQREIWNVQGRNRAWFCGAWLGYGFHEDGVQAGFAVAELMRGWQRPWAFDVAQERLARPAVPAVSAPKVAA